MSTYRNEYCPFCKKPLAVHERSEFFYYNRYVGLPYERCPYCNHIYSTNRKLYSNMTVKEKNSISNCYFFNILSTSFTLYAVIICLSILIASGIFKIDIGNIISYILIFPILPCIFLGYLSAKKEYSSLKKLSIDDFKIDEELKRINMQDNYTEDEDLANLLKKLK